MKTREILETKRLILRPFTVDDAALVQKFAGDFSVADTTLNIPYPYEDGIAEEWISTHQDKYESGELINYAITLKPQNDIIGAIGLTVTKEFNRAELGYWIGKPYWNQGYCTEASIALIDYAFKNHNLHKITANHFSRNPASGKVMQKTGMKLEGTLREHVKKWDKMEDLIMYGILKSEWEIR
ncbi:MAG: GNAT family N-acetyltransferase [Spirochaetales bacterium]|nr:GNAT family N-acetyltransferase [Spirochaetales bacterium]